MLYDSMFNKSVLVIIHIAYNQLPTICRLKTWVYIGSVTTHQYSDMYIHVLVYKCTSLYYTCIGYIIYQVTKC